MFSYDWYNEAESEDIFRHQANMQYVNDNPTIYIVIHKL